MSGVQHLISPEERHQAEPEVDNNNDRMNKRQYILGHYDELSVELSYYMY